MADKQTQPEDREAERNQLAEQSRRQHDRAAAAGTPAEKAPEKKSRVDAYHE